MADNNIFLVFVIHPLTTLFLVISIILCYYCHRKHPKCHINTLQTPKRTGSSETIADPARVVKEAEDTAREKPMYPRIFGATNENSIFPEERVSRAAPALQQNTCRQQQQQRPQPHNISTTFERPIIALSSADVFAIRGEVMEMLFRRFPRMPVRQAVHYDGALAEAMRTNIQLDDDDDGDDGDADPAISRVVDGVRSVRGTHELPADEIVAGVGVDPAGYRVQAALHRVESVHDLHGAYHGGRGGVDQVGMADLGGAAGVDGVGGGGSGNGGGRSRRERRGLIGESRPALRSEGHDISSGWVNVDVGGSARRRGSRVAGSEEAHGARLSNGV